MLSNPPPSAEAAPSGEFEPVAVLVCGRPFTIHRLDGVIMVNGQVSQAAIFWDEGKVWVSDPGDPDHLARRVANVVARVYEYESDRKAKARRAGRKGVGRG